MEEQILIVTLMLLGASILSVTLARITRMPAIGGFFVFGLLLGEILPTDIVEQPSFKLLAEIGISFLLFDIGLHLPISKLISSWKNFFVEGPIQVLVVTAGLGAVLILFGVPPSKAFFMGFVLSLSSTAVVIQLLQSRNEVDTPAGRRAVALLVFQDIAAVLSLSLLPVLAKGESLGTADLMAQVAVLLISLVAVVIIGQLLLNPFFRWIVSLREADVFTASSLFCVLFLSWLATHLGLSMALGAFLAGVCLAGSRYGYLVQSEIQPFRTLLLSLFFLSVGIKVDLIYLLNVFPLLLMFTIGFITLKAALNSLALRITTSKNDISLRVGGILSQGSEFAFAIAPLAAGAGFLTNGETTLLNGIVGLSMLTAPLLAGLSCILSRRCACIAHEPAAAAINGNAEVIIAEFDQLARDLADAFDRAGIPYRGHDRDLDRLALASSYGYRVFYSDPDRPRTLSLASQGHVSAVVSLIEDDQTVRLLIEGLRKVSPQTPILAATSDLARFEILSQLDLQGAYIKNERTVSLLLKNVFQHLGREDDPATYLSPAGGNTTWDGVYTRDRSGSPHAFESDVALN